MTSSLSILSFINVPVACYLKSPLSPRSPGGVVVLHVTFRPVKSVGSGCGLPFPSSLSEKTLLLPCQSSVVRVGLPVLCRGSAGSVADTTLSGRSRALSPPTFDAEGASLALSPPCTFSGPLVDTHEIARRGLTGNALTLSVKAGRTVSLTVSSVSLHGHGASLHLFSSLMLFIGVVQCFSHGPCTYFVRFIPVSFWKIPMQMVLGF